MREINIIVHKQNVLILLFRTGMSNWRPAGRMQPHCLSNAAQKLSNLIIKLLETDFRTGKVEAISKLQPTYSFFFALYVILRPPHGFEFDVPALDQ
jgi:hypothetical protein